ncbi:hypothetical protein FJ434_20735 [Mesorhizobium sp. B2-5-13]|nr:hypothetical protein FJ434_20735 [Mesorhizobium sp. B2-5-13]TPK45937.1 hypothetical protein FJ560_19950 [Mesorhizobium sp. B2-5-5]
MAASILICSIGQGAAAEVRIANWNIQTLVYAGDPHTVFPDDHVRQPADFADLRSWRDKVATPVFFLQEVTSPAALNEVFPVADGWEHCISGQFAQDENLTQGPICTKAGDNLIKPAGETRTQYTGVAWRPSAGVTVDSVVDVADLNVRSDDPQGIRNVRWGLDVTLHSGETAVRVLVVHLKSGCFDDFMNFKFFTVDPATTPPERSSCNTIARQMYPLHKWLRAREEAGDTWMIVGDFNRRLDAGAGTFQDEVWQALSAYSPGSDGLDRDARPDTELFRAPYKKPSLCWADLANPYPTTLADADDYNMSPIEFFVFGKQAAALIDPSTEEQIVWAPATAADPKRLSDHCPARLTLETK